MKETEKRLRQWLADPANIHCRAPAIFPQRGFEEVLLRQPFITRNGYEISIQQGASHYCNGDQVEMWYCPHRPMLDEYGTGEDPYGWVPISVAADYIEALEGESA